MDILFYFLGGILAGICNATAGGGTFITFPLFVAQGINPIVANVSSAVAIYPGHALGAYGYRKILIQKKLIKFKWVVLCLVGAIFGSYLLTIIENQYFNQLVPILIALATCLFVFGNRLNIFLQKISTSSNKHQWVGDILLILFSIYGSFFGAGLGVMLMAGLLIMGVDNIQHNNALKNALGAIITFFSVIIFISVGLVDWKIATPTLLGAILGGIWGAKIAQRLNVRVLKSVVIIIGIILTFYYGYRVYG